MPPIARLKPVSAVPASPALCPARHPPQSVAACLFRAARRSSWSRRRFRAGGGSPQASRPAGRRGVEQAHARLSGTGAAIARARRRAQCRIPLSRSEMPWLQHASGRGSRHRAVTEGNAGPRTRTLHALQGLLGGSRLSLQAEPSGCAAHDQDHGERSALDMVAGRNRLRMCRQPAKRG